MANKIPRGIRNNNPFNIKKSNQTWCGRVQGTDKVFETFLTRDLGIRAGLLLFRNYIKHGFNTPRKILSRFAPANENDTEDYIYFVSRHTLLGVDDPIVVPSSAFFDFCSTVIRFENGLNGDELCNYGFGISDLRKIYNKYLSNF